MKELKEIKIGAQTWSAHNLTVCHFQNGDEIFQAVSDEDWENAANSALPAWCYYNNDGKKGQQFGKLYNWYAVNDPRILAPSGWCIPTQEEWVLLQDCLGPSAGLKLKSKEEWFDSANGIDSHGFRALPGGYRDYFGRFNGLNKGGGWWTKTEDNENDAIFSFLQYTNVV